MTHDGLGLRQGTLGFAPYDAVWAQAFANEAEKIASALPSIDYRIEHIGSTSVPGLAAKPILDIGMDADETDFDAIATALVGLGYIDRGERSGRLFIRLRDREIRTHNLHLYAPGSQELEDQLRFRDALRTDPALREAYAAEKHRIYTESGGQRRGYAEAKTDFIRAALAT